MNPAHVIDELERTECSCDPETNFKCERCAYLECVNQLVHENVSALENTILLGEAVALLRECYEKLEGSWPHDGGILDKLDLFLGRFET